MRVQYERCSNVPFNIDRDCVRFYKIYTCLKTSNPKIQKVKFFKTGHHLSLDIQLKAKRGLSEKTKNIYQMENLLCNYDSLPKRIHIRIKKLIKKKEFS